MPPKPYYEINPQAYLYGKTDDTPEEKVRQWVLFELLSTYGIWINNIEVERQVKVGTRNHRADIVILRESTPYVVIECKKWDDRKPKQGMQQALSYADANTMKAHYAVYTNGDIWEVKRKMGSEWVIIPDLPKRIDGDYRINLDELVRSIDDFKPAFYWLNQTVPADSAFAYFSCLQRIFNGSTYPLNYLDKNLLFGADNLLRVICAKGSHVSCLQEKMVAACKSFSLFFDKRLDQGVREDFIKNDDLWHMMVNFKMRFEMLVKDTRDLQSEDALFSRVIVGFFQYLKNQLHGKNKRFCDVPATLTREFQQLLGHLFQVHLSVCFPDSLLEESCTDLRIACSKDWEDFKLEMDKCR